MYRVVSHGANEGHTSRPPRDQCVSAVTNTASHLQSRLKPSPHKALWIMEQYEAGQRRSSILMEVRGGSHLERSSGNQQQSFRNHPRASFAFHTHDSIGDGSRPLLSGPTQSTSDMPLIFHSAIMENWTFVNNFPRMWGAHAPFME